MNVLSHALLPALACASLFPRRTARQFYAAAGSIAVAGALPDLLHPHLSLAARYASWPHTVFALGAVAVAALAVALLGPRGPVRWVAVLAALAYASHLGLDAISGGIAWLYPWSRQVAGLRLVRFPYWFPIDLVLACSACAVVLWMRQRFWALPPPPASHLWNSSSNPRPPDER